MSMKEDRKENIFRFIVLISVFNIRNQCSVFSLHYTVIGIPDLNSLGTIFSYRHTYTPASVMQI